MDAGLIREKYLLGPDTTFQVSLPLTPHDGVHAGVNRRLGSSTVVRVFPPRADVVPPHCGDEA